MIKKKTIFELKANYYCNIKCNFCIFSERKGQNQSLTSEQILEVVKGISEKYPKIDCFVVSGGEPTVRKDLWEILNAVYEYLKPQRIVIHTNGLILPPEEEIKKMVEKKVVIFLSFHTLSSETYFQFTYSKNLPILIKNLDKFTEGGITVFSNTLIMKPNQNEIEKIGDYLFKQGVRKMEFRFPFGTGSRRMIFPWIIPDDFLGITHQLLNLLKKYSNEVTFFIHPSVLCLLRQKIPKKEEALLEPIIEMAKKSVNSEEFISGEGVKYLFLDPRMRLVREKFQQTAINGPETIFKKIDSCRKCIFKDSCLGVPIEFLDG